MQPLAPTPAPSDPPDPRVPSGVSASPAAVAALTGLLGRALDHEEGLPPVRASRPSVPVPDDDLILAIEEHRAAGVLAEHADRLDLPAGVRAAIERWRVGVRPALMMHLLDTARVWAALTEAGIPTLVVKGAALAAVTTGRPEARGLGDIDLLVPPDRVRQAHGVLLGLGWRLAPINDVAAGGWAWRHLLRWGNELAYEGAATTVDLHWRLDIIPGAHPPFATLWRRRIEVDLGGPRVATLGPRDALRHLAVHGEAEQRLRTLADIRRLLRHPEALPLDPAVAPALALVADRLGLPAALGSDAESLLARGRRAHGRGWTAGRIRQVRGPRGVATLVVTALMPADDVVALANRPAWRAVPLVVWRALVRRVRRR